MKIDVPIDVREERVAKDNSRYSSLGTCRGRGGEDRRKSQGEEGDNIWRPGFGAHSGVSFQMPGSFTRG